MRFAAAQDRATKDQKFGWVGSAPETLGQHLDRLVCLFQPIEQAGEVQAAFDVIEGAVRHSVELGLARRIVAG